MRTWTRRKAIGFAGLSVIGTGLPFRGLVEAAARPNDIGDGKRVTLLHFTDTHAQLETHPEYVPGANPDIQMMGGYARLKTAIEHERANCAGACFLFDGGDEFQGSGPAAWSEGEVILEPLKALGIDVFTPGNWEPAYGPERFKQTMARLDCPDSMPIQEDCKSKCSRPGDAGPGRLGLGAMAAARTERRRQRLRRRWLQATGANVIASTWLGRAAHNANGAPVSPGLEPARKAPRGGPRRSALTPASRFVIQFVSLFTPTLRYWGRSPRLGRIQKEI